MGSPAPDFAALDVVSGKELALADLEGKPALLFFSEGAACDACMVQAQKLEADRAFRETGIQLVSVTTDPEPILRQVAANYEIDTPLLSDPGREVSEAYGMLGRGGMGHPDTNGHAFMLIDENGVVQWERAYAEMFVPTGELVAELEG